MKIMISQPMQGKSIKQIRDERKDLVERLISEGYEVIDTVFMEEPPKNTDEAIYYLAKSIDAMVNADVVIFMKDWDKTRGCRVEFQVAVEYGKKILYDN